MLWADKHPGELATAMIRRMQSSVDRLGVRAPFDPNNLPVVANNYYLNRMTHKMDSRRNKREAFTLCTILDHLTLGECRGL
jgi:hypothetical protein